MALGSAAAAAPFPAAAAVVVLDDGSPPPPPAAAAAPAPAAAAAPSSCCDEGGDSGAPAAAAAAAAVGGAAFMSVEGESAEDRGQATVPVLVVVEGTGEEATRVAVAPPWPDSRGPIPGVVGGGVGKSAWKDVGEPGHPDQFLASCRCASATGAGRAHSSIVPPLLRSMAKQAPAHRTTSTAKHKPYLGTAPHIPPRRPTHAHTRRDAPD